VVPDPADSVPSRSQSSARAPRTGDEDEDFSQMRIMGRDRWRRPAIAVRVLTTLVENTFPGDASLVRGGGGIRAAIGSRRERSRKQLLAGKARQGGTGHGNVCVV